MDKNESIIKFLMQCPTIQANPLFFNFANEEDGNNHVITGTDKTKKHFVDGSILKQYTFTIAFYKSVAHVALVESDDKYKNQNMEDMATVQQVLDWIDEQAQIESYPDFGEMYEIEEMDTMTTDPDLDGVDTSVNPPIARYSISVRIEYIDRTKMLWNS